MTSARFTKGTAILVTGALLAWTIGPMPLGAEPAAGALSRQDLEAERNKQIVTAAFDRWAAGGSNFFEEMLSPDIVWTIEGSGPSAGTYRGRDDLMARAVRPLSIRLATPIRPVTQRFWADGDHVIIHWEGEAVAGDGRPYRNRYVWIFRMAGGVAVEVNAFLDLPAYDDVLRRIPAPEGEGAR